MAINTRISAFLKGQIEKDISAQLAKDVKQSRQQEKVAEAIGIATGKKEIGNVHLNKYTTEFKKLIGSLTDEIVNHR